MYQTFFDEQWNFEKPLNILTIRPNYKTLYKSSFQSQFPGTLNIDLQRQSTEILPPPTSLHITLHKRANVQCRESTIKVE